MDAHFVSVHLIGMHLMDVRLMGVHFMCVYLMGMHLTGMHLNSRSYLPWSLPVEVTCPESPRAHLPPVVAILGKYSATFKVLRARRVSVATRTLVYFSCAGTS
jgi:hypothetical protein